NVSGMIMVQEAQRGGFEAHVYPSHVAAAIQLLRVAIRRATNEVATIEDIESLVAELIASERADLEDDQPAQVAAVAVVLPERLLGDDGVCTESHYASGWNACHDEVGRLNAKS
ncbi:hypothetical protein, partial [Pseudomonas sp.]|uniref:hypothetical protein n=1 Tax=Pseudomonas sp. TaxID=306 RepID=UPI003D6E0054